MTNEQLERLRASLRAWPLRTALQDLELEREDPQRFTRMVDSRGHQVWSHDQAVDTVERLLQDEDLRLHLADEMVELRDRAQALGIVIKELPA